MNKFIFTLVLLLGFAFSSSHIHEEDAYYGSLDKEGAVVGAAYNKKKKDGKDPLRKRYLKRKRRVRNPAQGK